MAVQTALSPTTDQSLLAAMAAGDTAALDELYARYGGGVFGFLMAKLGDPALAEEVVQDVMLAAWRGAAHFRGESKTLTWLLAIAHNQAINATRRRRVSLVPFQDALDYRSDETGPLEHLVRRGEEAAVRDALDRLPAPHREILVLVFYHHLTLQEVADVLGIALGTVKSRLHRAKDAMRRELRREGSG